MRKIYHPWENVNNVGIPVDKIVAVGGVSAIRVHDTFIMKTRVPIRPEIMKDAGAAAIFFAIDSEGKEEPFIIGEPADWDGCGFSYDDRYQAMKNERDRCLQLVTEG